MAVDPGDTTGVATLDYIPRFVSYSYGDFLDYLRFFEGHGRIATFVVEQFVTRPGNFARIQYAGRVIGAIDYFARKNGARVVYQQPSTVKTMIPLKELKSTPGWSCKTAHEWDALRHLIYYLLTRK